MPRNRALLHLNMASRRALRVVLEDLQHLIHPAHIQVRREVAPHRRARLALRPEQGPGQGAFYSRILESTKY